MKFAVSASRKSIQALRPVRLGFQPRWASTTSRGPPVLSLKGKTIAVTGGAGGMGKELLQLLLRYGAKVSAADLKAESLTKVVEDIKRDGYEGEIMTQALDVTDEKGVDEWIQKTTDRFGPLDGAVNLAGFLPRTTQTPAASVEGCESDVWHMTLAINLTGAMHCMRAQLRNMKDYGSIVNAGSVGGIMGHANSAAYCAAKFGVIGLTKCAAQEVGPKRNIRVNAIAPGSVNTAMIRDIGIPKDIFPQAQALKREGEPDEMAALCCWLLSDESSYITGTVQSIDGGWAN